MEAVEETVSDVEVAEVVPLRSIDERSIFERMAAILAELPAIGKTQKNKQQNFMFRGHDDVLNALNPLLSRHCVFVVPNVLERATDQRTTAAGATMYEVNLHVRFCFYGLKGDCVEASAWGEGTDMGDKSTNKAMTMAFKNVLMQSFAISTEESYDTDGGTPEETTRGGAKQAPASQVKMPSGWKEWTEMLASLGVPPEDSKEWLRQMSDQVDVSTEAGKTTLFAGAKKALIALHDPAINPGGVPIDLTLDPRTVIRRAFASAFGGVELDGPAWRISPAEEDRPARGQPPEPPAGPVEDEVPFTAPAANSDIDDGIPF